MNKYLFIVIAILLGVIYAGWCHMKDASSKWEVAEANLMAYSDELSLSNKHNTALQLTVDQLEYFNDSILKALDDTRRELKVKDKDLKALQSVKSTFSRVDTLYLDKVIYKEPSFALDTVIGDSWYTLKLGLKYPSMVVVEPEFKSEKHIIVSTKKETVNPPKKFFLLRWFQRRHVVLHVDVVEKNPYVNNETNRYVEIIK